MRLRQKFVLVHAVRFVKKCEAVGLYYVCRQAAFGTDPDPSVIVAYDRVGVAEQRGVDVPEFPCTGIKVAKSFVCGEVDDTVAA